MSDTRVIVISGKGGVGKTTIACTTAVAAADAGHRTLVVSLDRAHSLGDVLGISLGDAAVNVPLCENLSAVEIDPLAILAKTGSVLREYLERLFSYLGVKGAAAEELAVFPGLEELLVLTKLAELAESGTYDLIVTDMAPTASSIRYLSFPDMMEGVLGKLVTWDQRFAQLLRPFQGKHFRLPVPDNEVYDSIRDISARLSHLKRLLQDPSRTAVRLVMVPESIVLDETRRALTYLSLFGLTVDSVIVNRIFPDAEMTGYFSGWKTTQSRVISEAMDVLADLPILRLEFQRMEVLGVENLRQSATKLYGGSDPYDFHQAHTPLFYERDEQATLLNLRLPFASSDGLDLRRRDSELIVTVGDWRRTILLPDALSLQTVTKAKFADGVLCIRFEPGTKGVSP